MKKTIVLFIFAIVMLIFIQPVFLSANLEQQNIYSDENYYLIQNQNTEQLVFFCENGSTKVYHTNRYCTALERCRHRISEINIQQARNRGLRACRRCN